MTANEPPALTTGALCAQRLPRWYTGRSELVVVAGVLALAVALTVGTVTMQVPEGTAFPGPQFFPTLVAVFLYVVAIALAVEVWRSPARAHVADHPVEISDEMLRDLARIDDTAEIRVVSPEDVDKRAPDAAGNPGTDRKTVLLTIAALAAFIVVLPFAGWLISAAALFWVISWAFGSTRPLFDVGVAAIVSSVVQLAFGAGLGLSLPAGFLAGVA